MKIIADNKKANYNYSVSNKIEAGIVLTGSEVKSLRINTGSIRGSYIIEQKGELWLSNSFIKKYQNANDKNYDPSRNRKLLVTKKEFNKISGSIKQGGLTIIPLTFPSNICIFSPSWVKPKQQAALAELLLNSSNALTIPDTPRLSRKYLVPN